MKKITETMDRGRGTYVGEFFICPCVDYPDGTKSVWVEQYDGEGGQFPSLALEKILRKFYDENF